MHPEETSSWQEEVKHFEYRYTKSFRVVPPYTFEFGTSIKARWIHRPLLEVFSQEFPYFEDSEAYYREAMSKGRLRVNDEVVDTSYRCRDGDVVTHHVHRHEPPVTSHAVRILLDTHINIYQFIHTYIHTYIYTYIHRSDVYGLNMLLTCS